MKLMSWGDYWGWGAKFNEMSEGSKKKAFFLKIQKLH